MHDICVEHAQKEGITISRWVCRVVDSCVGVWLLQGCFDFEIDDGKGGRLSLTVEVRRSRQAHIIPVTHIYLMCHSYSHALTPHVHTHVYQLVAYAHLWDVLVQNISVYEVGLHFWRKKATVVCILHFWVVCLLDFYVIFT